MTWHQHPHWVSEGAEKNFARFSAWLQENPIQVDQLYFEHLVAKAIVFQGCDSVVRQMDLGGYKANVVAYAVAWMSYLMGATFNLERVWLTQVVSENTRDLFAQLARKCFDHITNPPGRIRNVTEWSKKEECWLALRDQPIKLGGVMDELIKPRRQPAPTNGETPDRMGRAENLQLEQEVIGMRAPDWYRLARWMAAGGKATTWERNFVTKCALGLSRGREITAAQMPHALRIYMEACAEGFTLEQSTA
jgi:hypothetical protein